jgi:hypothetical protein
MTQREVSGSNHISKKDRVAGGDAGFAEALHVFEKFFFPRRQDVARGEHEIDFFQQRGRLFDGNPVAGVSSVVDDSLQQNGELRSGIVFEMAKELADIFDAPDVAEKLGDEVAFVFAGFLEPAVVLVPFFRGGIAGEGRTAGFVPGEALGKRMRLGLAIANTGAANEAI